MKGMKTMFNAEKEVNSIIEFVQEYYQKYNLKGAVIGISGGKDSAVVAALLVKALGKENVIGFTLPCHSSDEDMIDAKLISDYYGFKLYNFNLTGVYDTFKKELGNTGEFNALQTKNSDINIKPRLRMTTLYYMASLFSEVNNKPYLVIGTSNKSELYVGYFTKGGDSVHDIALISDFTVSEVIKLGESSILNVPRAILYKTPSDGLSNQSDEDKLGVSYHVIEKCMNNDNDVDINMRNKVNELHEKSFHKFNIPSYKRKEE